MGRVSQKQMKLNHKKFIKKYLETGNAAEAVRQVYPNDHHPDSTGSKLLNKPNIQEAIQAAFAKYDREVDKEIGELIEVADAKEMKDLPTYTEKIKANELLLKLRGAFNQPNMNLNFSITGKIEELPKDQAQEMLNKIREKNNQIVR